MRTLFLPPSSSFATKEFCVLSLTEPHRYLPPAVCFTPRAVVRTKLLLFFAQLVLTSFALLLEVALVIMSSFFLPGFLFLLQFLASGHGGSSAILFLPLPWTLLVSADALVIATQLFGALSKDDGKSIIVVPLCYSVRRRL